MIIEIELNNNEFKEQVQKFEQFLTNENKSESYIAEKKRNVKEFLQFVEESSIESLQAIDQNLINSYILHLEEQRVSRFGGLLEQGTIAKNKNSIRTFWLFLGKEEVKVNPIKVKHIRRGEQKRSIALSHEEIRQLYSVCDTSAIGYRDKMMLSLFYGCGMRKSEGLRLLISDIDFNRGRIHVRKSKTNRERYVMMSPVVQKQVEEYVFTYRYYYLHEQSQYDDVFIGERGTPIQPETIACRMDVLWQRVKDRYGSDKKMIGCHMLRHSLGTHLYIAKMDIQMIALMLGHRTLESTQLYIHSANQLKK